MDQKLNQHYIDLGLLSADGKEWTQKAKDEIKSLTRVTMSELIYFGKHHPEDAEKCKHRLKFAGFSESGYASSDKWGKDNK